MSLMEPHIRRLGRAFSLGSSLTLLTLTFLIATPATAQTPEQVSEVTKSLSPQSQAVIRKLSELNSFPTPNWKMKVGAFPHAETINFDDSSWTKPQPNFEMPAGQATWYRAWIEIPKNLHGYDISGSKIWFKFRY